jgi:hypothetical protein
MITFLQFLKALILFLAYSFGKRDAQKDIESKTNEKALEEATKTIKSREETRARFDLYRSNTPDTWDGVRKKSGSAKS